MEPVTARLDPQALLSTALVSTTQDVYTDTDASMDPSQRPVTVVQTTARPHGPLTRWSMEVDVTLVTYAASTTDAYTAHTEVADQLLALTEMQSPTGPVAVSSVTCTMEPSDLKARTAPEWPGQVSTYTLYLRNMGE